MGEDISMSMSDKLKLFILLFIVFEDEEYRVDRSIDLPS
jgi:hypothetical protein